MADRGDRRLELVPGGVRLVTAARSRPGVAPWVVVLPRTVGLCSSDLKEVRRRRDVRSDFGHELVGEVHSSTVDALPPGLRVGLDPHVPVRRDTAFGDAMLLSAPEEALRAALPVIPEGTPDDRAVFTEPLACATHCAGNVRPGADVAVVGAGTAGVLLTVLLRLAGCRVTLVNRSRGRLEALSRTALLHDVPMESYDGIGQGDHDTVVVTTAMLDDVTFETAWRLLPPADGRLVLFGGIPAQWRMPGTGILLDAVRRGEQSRRVSRDGRDATVVGTHGATSADFASAAAVLARPLPWTGGHVDELIAGRLSLPELAVLLNDAVRTGADPAGKHVVDIHRP